MGLTVVKVGGAVVGSELGSLEDAIVVHGGGVQITAALAQAGVESTFVGGRRVTGDVAIGVVRTSLVAVNEELCAAIGPRAVGMIGDEIGLQATRIVELGHAGSPVPSKPQAVLDALAAGKIPVVAPLAEGPLNVNADDMAAALAVGKIPVVAPLAEGPLNVNADDMAAALAVGLGAERILFLTDVPGVLRDEQVLEQVAAAEVETGEFEGGILPKLQAAVVAAREGVRAEIGETLVVA